MIFQVFFPLLIHPVVGGNGLGSFPSHVLEDAGSHAIKMEKEYKESFEGLGIRERLLSQLGALGFKTPTPIQKQSIPVGLTGEDFIGIAQTGTGKTLAFAVPMIQRLAETKGKGLILLPTRELALQVNDELQKVGRGFGLRTAVLIGGASMYAQIKDIQRKPHIIVATPGRLNDHLEQKKVSLKDVRTLVLDEADRMLDMGFEPQIRRILETVPKERQTMLFSATMPKEIEKIANEYMKKPLRIEVAPSGTAAELVEQEAYFVSKDQKAGLLAHILKETAGAILVFSRTKHGARKIATTILKAGHTAAELHSNRSLAQRKLALAGFKKGTYKVLVATDIAARGIDVKNIELVINYDLPDSTEDYVHRIGRTGRAGRNGKAISFVMPDQKGDLKSIERLIRSVVPVRALPKTIPALSQRQSVAPARPFVQSQKRAPYKKHDKNRGYRSHSIQKHTQKQNDTSAHYTSPF